MDRRHRCAARGRRFEIGEVAREYARGPRPLAFVYSGMARRRE